MRGEEVQLFGALASGAVAANGAVCHPGTHNKWVRIVDGRIVSFRTVMTGEMFGLLRKHGILADMLVGDVTPDAAFHAGVRRGVEGADPHRRAVFGPRASPAWRARRPATPRPSSAGC